MDEIARMYRPTIEQMFSFDFSSPCEVCGNRLHCHDWVDLDPAGFAVWCNIASVWTFKDTYNYFKEL